MPIKFFSILLSGFLLSLVFVQIFKKFAIKRNLLISNNIPSIGGIAIGVSFLFTSIAGFWLCKGFTQDSKGILLASFVMLILGVIDDYKELSIIAKFSVQVVATFFLVFSGVHTNIIYLGFIPNVIITFIWVLGITNAVNHLDIIDGLAGGSSLIVVFSFFILALSNYDMQTIVLSLALIGAIFGFLVYNIPPAKVYLGNGGSHSIGFILASLAIVISYAPFERKVALLSPLFILGLPIFDTAFLIITRWSQGKSALKKSDDHLALRFLRLGFSKTKSLFIMLILGIFFSFCGVILSKVSNLYGLIIVIFSMIICIVVAGIMYRVNHNV